MLFLAVRFLLSRKPQTILVMLGAVLGTAAYITLSGIMGGFHSYITNRLISSDAHLRIQPGEHYITREDLNQLFDKNILHVFWTSPPTGRQIRPYITFPQKWFERLRREPSVAAYTPQVIGRAYIKRLGVTKAIRYIGTKPETQVKVTTIEDNMLNGQFMDLEKGGNRVVIGKDLLDKLGAHMGETVTLINETGTESPYSITGVFQTGVKNIDETTVYMTLEEAQKLSDKPNVITDIAVRLKDIHQAKVLDKKWSRIYAENIQTWEEINANTLSIFTMQNVIGKIMTTTIVIVVSFGLYNILQMLINQKRHEIGMLRAMGFDKTNVISLFLYHGLVLGGIGSSIGLLLGFIFSYHLHSIKFGSLNIAIAGRLAISFSPWIYAQGFSITFLACVLSSFFPALAASRLTPIAVIRNQ